MLCGVPQGKKYRSAPENTRKVAEKLFHQEGTPEGPELPEDVTATHDVDPENAIP